MKKNLNLDLNLDGENEKTKELNLIKKASNKEESLIEEEKMKQLQNKINQIESLTEKQLAMQKLENIQSNQEATNILQIVPSEIAKVAKFFKEKKTKSHRLQVFITDETYYAIQAWKKTIGIKKDTDAVEALFRLALGLRQI